MKLQLSVAKIVVCSSEKCLVVMEFNATMFEETIYNVTYPLYATYMKLFGFLFMAVLVVIPSSYVIHVILKNKELRNTNNILIINLLITDIICSMVLCCIVVQWLIVYLADLDFYHYCDTIVPFIGWITTSTRMMILPPAAHRFICIAKPFTHKLIMTKRRIIMMIVALWVISTIPSIIIFNSDIRLVYVPSLGSCTTVIKGLDLGTLLLAIVYVTSVILTIISAVYLRHKIIHVKAYIRELHQFGMDRGKLNKSQKLKELLENQVKPTIGVVVVGGIDAACNFLGVAIVVFYRFFTTPIIRFQLYQTVLVPLFFLQLLSHSLSYGLYNKEIRDEMRPCYPKHSRVIVLNTAINRQRY